MHRRLENEPIRVLVVDDEASIRETLREMLLDFAYEVRCAFDGRDAVDAYHTFGPDIILLDMNMPNMGGLDVIRHIREDEGDHDVLITMLTSDHSPENKLQAFGAGANDFLYKPFDRAELLARVGVGARQVRLTSRLRRAFETIDTEMEMVARLQGKLLPEDNTLPVSWPDMPGVRVQSRYLPSGRASGDYYDHFRVRDGVLRVVVADVSGHGARAAFIMGMVRSLFRVSRTRAMGLCETVGMVNEQLCEIIREEDDFVTLLAVDMDFTQRRLAWINAGHCAALLAQGQQVVELPPTGTVLGFFDEEFEQREMDMPNEGGLFLYTDGFYDWARSDGELFDVDSFISLARKLITVPGDFPQQLMEALTQVDGKKPAFRDDVTGLWIRFGSHDEQQFKCPARPDDARALIRDVMHCIEGFLCDGDMLYDLNLALTEAVANVVEHAYEDEPGEVEVLLYVQPGERLRLDVKDWGTKEFKVDPERLKAPGPKAESGRGVFIISQLMDSLDVGRQGECNVVSFTKTPGKDAWKNCT